MTDRVHSGVQRRASGILNLSLAGTAKRQAFAPYLWEVAADREGSSLDQIPTASKLVVALTTARQLVESDVIHVPIKDSKSQAFEALRRLSVVSRDFDLAAVIPGPVELQLLRGLSLLDDGMDAFEDLARSVLEAGCDTLMVRECNPDSKTEGSFRAMAKLAAFFGSRTLALGPPNAVFAVSAGFDALDAGADGPVAIGVPVAPAVQDMPLPVANIVTSSWLVPPRAPDVEWLRRVARQVRIDIKE